MTAAYKNNLKKRKILFLDDYCEYLGPRNYVSMAMQRVPRFLMET